MQDIESKTPIASTERFGQMNYGHERPNLKISTNETPQIDSSSPESISADNLENGLKTKSAGEVAAQLAGGDFGDNEAQQRAAQDLGIREGALDDVGLTTQPNGKRDELPPLPIQVPAEQTTTPAQQQTEAVNEHPEINPGEVKPLTGDELRNARETQQGSPKLEADTVAPSNEDIEANEEEKVQQNEEANSSEPKPTPQETPQPEAQTQQPETTPAVEATDNQKRIDEINKEMDERNFEHEEELDRLVKSSKEKEELQSLQEKKWSELTREERARRRELEAKSKGETEQNLTPEQEAEKRKQEIEDLGTELMTKLAKGEEITSEEEERLQSLMAEQKMTEAGFTPDQARAAAKEALKLSKENTSRKTQEAKEKIQELMSLELQLISSRNLAQQLGEKRKEAIGEAKKAHDDAENAKPEERMRKKGIEYSKYYAVASLNGQIQGMKYTAQRINARRQDLEQQVRWNLGITGPWEALREWGGAQVTNVVTEITILAEEELPLGMGEGLGELQRGKLAAAGKI